MIHIPKEKIESCCFDGAEENFCWKTGTVAKAHTQSFFVEKSILRANLAKGFLRHSVWKLLEKVSLMTNARFTNFESEFENKENIYFR